MLAATAQAAEIAELNRKLRLSDEDIDHINKQFSETQGMRYYDISKNYMRVMKEICPRGNNKVIIYFLNS